MAVTRLIPALLILLAVTVPALEARQTRELTWYQSQYHATTKPTTTTPKPTTTRPARTTQPPVTKTIAQAFDFCNSRQVQGDTSNQANGNTVTTGNQQTGNGGSVSNSGDNNVGGNSGSNTGSSMVQSATPTQNGGVTCTFVNISNNKVTVVSFDQYGRQT